jgi:hypothetical protein
MDCVKPENAELENALKLYMEKVNKLKEEASSQKKRISELETKRMYILILFPYKVEDCGL